jgi:hypothetical protein
MRYAENTEVSVEKTRAEIERMFVRYGANRFASAVFEEGAAIAFQYEDKQAKLEAVECGIETFETAFLPYIVLSDGKTIGETMIPRLGEVIKTGLLALPGFG